MRDDSGGWRRRGLGGDELRWKPTRRSVLAAGGAVALGGVAGCLGRAASAVTDTDASPATFYGGDRETVEAAYGTPSSRALSQTPVDVVPLSTSIRGGSDSSTGEIRLGGWFTTAATKAQDYNSSRSNKPRTIRGDGVDGDDSDGDDETESASDADALGTALELERELLKQVDSALDALGRRSNVDAKNALERCLRTVGEIQTELADCPGDVCKTVRANADIREQTLRAASGAVDEGDWDEANASVREVRSIVESDIDRISAHLDPDSDGDGVETLDEALVEYLADEPTIGERFTVCLPDARLPGGAGALADELTPSRIVEYLTGEAGKCGEDDGSVYCWGDADGGELSAVFDDRSDDDRCVAAYATRGGVCVAGVPSDAEGAEEVLYVSIDKATPKLYDGLRNAPETLDEWGEGTVDRDTPVTPTLVCPVTVTPEGCPSPLPAVLYVTRVLREDQYCYCGGWIVDNGALYEDSCTLLVADGPTEVVSVRSSETDGEGDVASETFARDLSRQGSLVYDGGSGEDLLGHLPESLREGEGLDGIASLATASISKRSARTGRNPRTDTELLVTARDGPASDDEIEIKCVCGNLSAPLVVLDDDDGVCSGDGNGDAGGDRCVESVRRIGTPSG